MRYFFRNLHQDTYPKSTFVIGSEGVSKRKRGNRKKHTNFDGLSQLSIKIVGQFCWLSFSTHFFIFWNSSFPFWHFTKLPGCQLIFEILNISCFSRKTAKLSKGISLCKLLKNIFSFCNFEHELSVISDILSKKFRKTVQIGTCGLTTAGWLLLIFETRKLYHCENALQDFVNILSIFQF